MSTVLADAERDGQLATTSGMVDSEGSVARGNELGSISCVLGRSEVDRAGEDAGGFCLVALGRGRVVRAGHDDCAPL
jgi:hypothetical protein